MLTQLLAQYFQSYYSKKINLKKYLLIAAVLFASLAKAQKIDSIYINLYTDSLKKGTYNYINVDGLLSNGHYMPLDSTQLIFTSSAGKFYGNSLLIGRDFKEEKVLIKVVLRNKPSLCQEFEMYIKKKPDGELKTLDELMNEMKQKPKAKNKKS